MTTLMSRRWRRTVRDTIPQSRLARYVNCAYDEDRERLYADEQPTSAASDDFGGLLTKEDNSEPWMLPGVRDALRSIVGSDNSGRKIQQPQPVGEFYPSWQNVTVAQRDTAVRCNTVGQWLLAANGALHPLRQGLPSSKALRPHMQALQGGVTGYLINRFSSRRELSRRTLSSCSFSVLNRMVTHVTRTGRQARTEESAANARVGAGATGVQHLWGRSASNATQFGAGKTVGAEQQRGEASRRLTFQRHLPFQVDLQRPPPTLNAEVPEFFPKEPPPASPAPLGDLQMFGSTFGHARGSLSLPLSVNTKVVGSGLGCFSTEAAYQEDLFPYRHGHAGRFSGHAKQQQQHWVRVAPGPGAEAPFWCRLTAVD
ncbi:uncharacterized protein LOC113208478 [Frankliniella occidentalis]|uniref:Uncharacterized protein LOC113208478 n=1 Tax=Frankliniella occidentalis TaxID=133901 RepID=A0A9C6XUJ7_FRAOC|nr:uncharacterized protein LOC113208478 [Frankliniella occidentalis]